MLDQTTKLGQNTNRTIVSFFSMLLLLSLASCGPVYRTEYNFTPPDSESGKLCVTQCENNKFQCLQLDQMRYSNCQQQADFRYQMCENRRVYYYDRKGKRTCRNNCYCYRPTCYSNAEACEVQHRSCYENCGGRVDSETRCVRNCEKVQTNNTSTK